MNDRRPPADRIRRVRRVDCAVAAEDALLAACLPRAPGPGDETRAIEAHAPPPTRGELRRAGDATA